MRCLGNDACKSCDNLTVNDEEESTSASFNKYNTINFPKIEGAMV